jgi:TolB protein
MSVHIAKSLVVTAITITGLCVISACGGAAATIAPTPQSATSAVTLPATGGATQSIAASCSKTVNDALAAIKTRCNTLGANQVCYGNKQIETTLTKQVNFQTPGDIVGIADLKTIHTLPYNQQSGMWGIVVIRAAVDLPGTTAGQQVTFLMYGDTTLDSVSPTMQTVYFHTGIGQQACQELPPSGLMVQVPRGQHIKFSANGADITLGSTALLHAEPNQEFTVSVLQGQGTVSAKGVTQTVSEGFQTQLALQGTTASAPPDPPKPIPIQAVSGAPTNILPEPITTTQIQQAISVATAQAATPTSSGPATAAASITPALTWTPGSTLPPATSSQKRIAFVSNRDGKHDIYLMNADGSTVQRLTNTQNDAASPAWSPDGTHLAFSLFNGQVRQIYTINSNASNLLALTPTTSSADHPVWSPDGAHIAFDALANGNRDIWVMNADGTNAHAITNDPLEDAQPVWSPDGKSIAFASPRDGTRRIYIMDANGENLKPLTTAAGAVLDPAWSPDGKSIAFTSQRVGSSGIFAVDLDGSNMRQIAPGVSDAVQPTWSSDSTQIAFVSKREGGQAIYIVNIAGSDPPNRVTPLTSDNSNPAWQR